MEKNTLQNRHSEIVNALKRCGTSPQTQTIFKKAIDRFVDSIGKDPEKMTTTDVHRYLLKLGKSGGYSFFTFKIHYQAVRFYYEKVLGINFAGIELRFFHNRRRIHHHDVVGLEGIATNTPCKRRETIASLTDNS